MISGSATVEEWPLKVPFVISRSSRTHVDVVYLELSDGVHTGRGECQPNARYGENPAAIADGLNGVFAAGPVSQPDLCSLQLDSPSARNALDCALVDLAAKQAGRSALMQFSVPSLNPVQTVITISLGAPDEMAAAAERAALSGYRHLKLKLGGVGDDERVLAVRQRVPEASLIADANEAWTEAMLDNYLPTMADCSLELLEQPLPAGRDTMLASVVRTIPICADESCRTVDDLPNLVGKYDAVNIKLDKAGGVTPAFALLNEAKRCGLDVMVGCMLGTSLAMAPAFLLAQAARWADLDGPLLLREDRAHGFQMDAQNRLLPFTPSLWG